MATRVRGERKAWLLILLMVAGALIGSAIWGFLTPVLPAALANSYEIGMTGGPVVFNLEFIRITFALVLKFNLGSALGLIGAIVFFYCKR